MQHAQLVGKLARLLEELRAHSGRGGKHEKRLTAEISKTRAALAALFAAEVREARR
ncbi:MAG: hypothetical protein V4844_12185 [Pseudomonadota bacterium]